MRIWHSDFSEMNNVIGDIKSAIKELISKITAVQEKIKEFQDEI